MIEHSFENEVRLLRQAQGSWRDMPTAKRVAIVRRFRRLLVERCDALADSLVGELHKSPEEAYGGDIVPLAAHCRFLERSAAKLLRAKALGQFDQPAFLWGFNQTVHRRPWGVVGIIGTWNYPLFLNGVQITSALVAGNGVLWKPSELAGQSAMDLQNLLVDAGFPADLVQVVGLDRDNGPKLLEADIDYLVFTGSSPIGRKIAERLAQRLIPSTLELSGCDALIALPDANVSRVADAAWFCMNYNHGQTCAAVRRLIVPRSMRPALEAAFVQRLESVGPHRLRSAGQATTANRLIDAAVNQGAKKLGSGSAGTAESFPPTVLVDANATMEVCQTEFFAPVLSVLEYSEPEEIEPLFASSPFALEAKIFAGNEKQACRLARQLRVGSVSINDAMVAIGDPRTSFGGRAQSGWGVTQGAEGLLAMTAVQTVGVRGGNFRPHFIATGQKGFLSADVLRAMLRTMYGGMNQRVSAALSLPGKLFGK